MMKKLFILFAVFFSCAATGLQAQDYLPQIYSISLGGGVSVPHVEGNLNDFFAKNGDRAGYDLMLEGRYYFTPSFASGIQYDYLRMARLPDKMHLHFIRPNITYRYLWSNGNQGGFVWHRLYELSGTDVQPERAAWSSFPTRILRSVICPRLRVSYHPQILRSAADGCTYGRLGCQSGCSFVESEWI